MRRPWIVMAVVVGGFFAGPLADCPAQVGSLLRPERVDPSSPFYRGPRVRTMALRPYETPPPQLPTATPPVRVVPTRHEYFPGMRSGVMPNRNVPWYHPLGRPHCTPSRYGMR